MKEHSKKAHDKPPILGTWPRVYLLLLVWLLVLILIFYWITKYFNELG